ncbi:MAG: dephospho-CoA kinase [Bacteroidetes bacterium GWF2_38_335]|nr:MAG: dephospho-CoA kinase [Bacteroidetes bacterium GWF2_38_335]OFY79891.1 MAG: dephospho-CoA kinase [Bacteroidetes bacterium RIFOXYA12_FULL_38_20]HBS86346.1 dephospho-CoA kinase [Bacteroidales bacterium]
MIKVGVTGGIGSGKSTVCMIFKAMGIPVFNADIEAKSIIHSDSLLKNQIFAQFDVKLDNGEIDRKKLASLVFNNPEKLKLLNSLIHPHVFSSFANWIKKQSSPYVIIESAILFESGASEFVDETIVVTAPHAVRLQRVMERDGSERSEIEARMKTQLNDIQFLEKNAVFINNDGHHALIPQIIHFHNKIIQINP